MNDFDVILEHILDMRVDFYFLCILLKDKCYSLFIPRGPIFFYSRTLKVINLLTRKSSYFTNKIRFLLKLLKKKNKKTKYRSNLVDLLTILTLFHHLNLKSESL